MWYNYLAVDEKKITSVGIACIVRPSKKSVKIVAGTKIQFFTGEMEKQLE